jgi:hypothetical protein
VYLQFQRRNNKQLRLRPLHHQLHNLHQLQQHLSLQLLNLHQLQQRQCHNQSFVKLQLLNQLLQIQLLSQPQF